MRRALMLLLLGIAGCGESDELDLAAGTAGPRAVPGCPFDFAPCDVRETTCQLEKLAITACMRGDEPMALPSVSVMTEAEFGAYVDSQGQRPDPDYWEQAYVMLGLIEPGGLSAKSKPRRSSHEVTAFYRWRQKDIVLVDRGEPFDGLDANATLVHEFVHALQDREVDLEAFAASHQDNDDVYIAAKSVPEGEATLLAGRVRAAMLGLDVDAIDWETRLDELVARGEEWFFVQPSPLVAATEVLPYSHGARYLYPLWRDAGHDAVLQLFANPPTSSKSLLFGRAVDVETLTHFPELEPPAGIELFGTSKLGALGLYLMLFTDLVDRDRTRELVLSFRDDELSLYVDSETESPIVVLSIEASADTLTRLESRLQQRVPHLESQQSGERLRVAASTNSSLNLLWAVEGDL